MPKKAKKKSDLTPPAETPAPRHEPDESGLDRASQALAEPPLEVQAQAAMSGSPDEGIAEAMAEAADTFEQAFEERLPAPHPVSLPPDLHVSESTEMEPAAKTVPESEPEPEGKTTPPERPPLRLDRLQKILSQAGVASRRHAEEMITQGRVQVNGQVVTALGSKADPQHDHIRVDGKLLHGAERLRYFVLNKPRGYVTTVSDPEGRPTVMEFFKKMRERLYPVGRLDYLSEGLLLMTNDGDLANKLTRPASGVEKTYLVKVSGRPGEEQLDRLRAGLAIDRTRPGEGRVSTAPASVRLARQGDNPWYELVLSEGRNRELRKMFEEIGHHVEKIRRVGYGPLVLDVEPGRFRELEPDEVARLRLAAEGKWRKPKPKPTPKEQERRGPQVAGRKPGGQQRTFAKPPAKRAKEWSREDRRSLPPRAVSAEGNRRAPGARGSSTRPAAPGPGRPRQPENRAFVAGTGRRQAPPREEWKPQRGPAGRGRADGAPRFDRKRDARGLPNERGPRSGPRPDVRNVSARPSGQRPPATRQGRPASGGQSRPPSARPPQRRSSSQAGPNRSRDQRGKRR
jgi:23S rRNA pseudouridine2605 synthase